MKKNGKRGLPRLVAAFHSSLAGLRSAFQEEEAFRQELLLCMVFAPLAFWIGENGFEQALLVGSLLLILIVEILNSAVETVVDRIGLERHPLSGKAKDMGSAAVFLSLVNAAVIWLLIFLG